MLKHNLLNWPNERRTNDSSSHPTPVCRSKLQTRKREQAAVVQGLRRRLFQFRDDFPVFNATRISRLAES